MKGFTRSYQRLILSAIMLFMVSQGLGQEASSPSNPYPAGISLKGGIGFYSLKDEYISKEKYSGELPCFSFGWSRVHEKHLYILQMDYRNSDEIYNHNVSTNIYQFTLNQGFLYPLKKSTLLNRDLYTWLGPSTELFFYYSKPDIAVSGFDYAQSFAGLLGAAINFEALYPIGRRFQLESSLQLSVLSLGLRIVDLEEEDESIAKLLTLFSGLYSSIDLGARYHLSDGLSVKLGYDFELTNISAWKPLVSANDLLTLGLTFKL
jgi:hypothetical protein